MVPRDPDKRVVGDSIWCGGAACLLVVIMDLVALAKGSRADIPASALWVAVAGLLLPVLNVYFVVKDLVMSRRRAAAGGVALSLLALTMALYPPWGRYVMR